MKNPGLSQGDSAWTSAQVEVGFPEIDQSGGLDSDSGQSGGYSTN